MSAACLKGALVQAAGFEARLNVLHAQVLRIDDVFAFVGRCGRVGEVVVFGRHAVDELRPTAQTLHVLAEGEGGEADIAGRLHRALVVAEQHESDTA